MKTGNMTMTSTDDAPSTRRPLALIGLLVLVLALNACGSDDEEVSAGAATDTAEQGDTTNDQTDQSGDEEAGDTGDPETGYQLTTSETDMISAEKAPITEAVPSGDQTLAVRFSNGSEPCSLANVLVEETDTSITVSLETGLHPDVAAMSCIAQVVDYEIQVELDSPIGDREIIVDNP